MSKKSKRYQKAAELVDIDKQYGLEDAVGLIKKFPAPKFDPTVTLSFKLGVDPRKSDQMVRGSVALPHGTGKQVKVVVFATGDAAKAAEAAGADEVGMEDLIKKVQEGFTDFDAAIATPDAMLEVRKIARVLGPRGLMPNPKTGTVTEDTAAAVNAVKAGRIDYKLDKNGNIAAAVGKASFSEAQLTENTNALLDSVVKAKPASAKGNYIENVTLSASMCPGVALDSSLYAIN
ncbi:50S ribosomal protein L1 [Verrucomicrobiaceae bacterium R5-34]|uniref:Large ribosomal subunit protein uL1 n=1 Tax=Oceaniferula flava TaxID=2800421 RepID=A0AAE2SB17_9BACT|nr:50S ribosomal protein L1 [Oceaniferula flavus]MBK1830015.1 50S ribosomal protein L1 [Verrucomicrobiaceae bacterium R5-34]MBK1855138.1 50S ribosomal protein L1 [Oceaniferula flavus]MBM1136444.1 50S ribosomal protein L1 [Oceaniferula flavus]